MNNGHHCIVKYKTSIVNNPDGLPGLFFQKYWHIVGEDVKRMVLEILNGDKDPTDMNRTFITLIPKCKNPTSPKDFRPISLCNVVMKLVSKTIANRVKMVLPNIIDKEQSAFVQGRLITDNALVAMECFHWMKKKTKGKKGIMAVKLDMSKAYDRMEWRFVVGALEAMGFPRNLTTLIEKCISTVSFQVLVNGQPSRIFYPERGLRQGDPLSPYLFVICADVLSGLLKKGVAEGSLNGIQVARRAPKISHLFFADDSILFSRANINEAEKILDVLSIYQQASGQMVNLEKSEASFSRNVRDEVKQIIYDRMGVKTVVSQSRYLGLPVVLGRSKKEVFSLLVERIWKKVKGWKEGFLSRAGKEVLIKAVAQAIPSYIMSCYKIPTGVCEEKERMLARFWWGAKNGERKIHWMSWERMSKAKGMGGMGFKGISDFNTSLLGKHYWRLMKEETSLLSEVWKGRYYPNCKVQEAGVGFSPSYAWRSVQSSKELVLEGSRWRIGNGRSLKIWEDKWVPNGNDYRILGLVRGLDRSATVDNLIDSDMCTWNRDRVLQCFDQAEAKQVLSIPLSLRSSTDSLIWHREVNGNFPVKSAYHLCKRMKAAKKASSSNQQSENFWKKIWKVPVLPRVQNFIWRLSKDIIPTKTNLQKKGCCLETLCPFCSLVLESPSHIFLHCQFAKRVWFALPTSIRIPEGEDVINWLKQTLGGKEKDVDRIICITLWKIWKARNLVVFEKKGVEPWCIGKEVMEAVWESKSAVPDRKRTTEPEMDWNQNLDEFHYVFTDAGCFPNGSIVLGLSYPKFVLPCQY
ncbi:uncharacterized protein LOC131658300 [Vicia villosa]|uniref:uncharacterized protein LOC131658300 n=1 Tax=Vicia villosa TaxID=3911 RepID=UPI00273BF348|nr:uncharacterized protein LOC131658300 [Vicia villosa]